MLASSRELGELYEEEFEDEQWDCQAASCSCSRDTRLACREQEEHLTRSTMSQLHQRKPLWTCPQCGRQFANQNQSHTCARYTLAEHLEGKSRGTCSLPSAGRGDPTSGAGDRESGEDAHRLPSADEFRSCHAETAAD